MSQQIWVGGGGGLQKKGDPSRQFSRWLHERIDEVLKALREDKESKADVWSSLNRCLTDSLFARLAYRQEHDVERLLYDRMNAVRHYHLSSRFWSMCVCVFFVRWKVSEFVQNVSSLRDPMAEVPIFAIYSAFAAASQDGE